ncbi:hypothetical protein A8L34_26330 [Bacillus sp. FJAT-27264]|uniref:stalk domain-containing protein n=1 Tax=Paenibacillus sp. (strain DSM 101736 / FJAT-27264) TaxID=1850362 RepID=UPI000807DAC5|nr:stalk domain-containing protein [Bacillus sp. FJAT-27264]OBZ07642.1 hypothetical protein A8L34_26330 [Bacillus sp. FJAT-27264]
MKSKKMIIATMVFGMAVTGSAGVYAGTNLEKISAYLNHGLGFKVNGSAYTPVDGNGNKLAPITYKDTTYLPVRALADALKVPVTFDGKTNQVIIGKNDGGSAPSNGGSTTELSAIQYTAAQKQAIQKAFAQFKGFETAYAPTQMTKGDAFDKVAASDDGVSFLFKHMRIVISARDYSGGYASQAVQLSNGVKAKWYSPSSDTQLLGFNLNDRVVTISSPDKSLSKAQLEKVAVGVAKLSK